MPRILIVGAGALGRQLAGHMTRAGEVTVAGFVDDTMAQGEEVDGFPIVGGLEDAPRLLESVEADAFLIAIGYEHFAFRKKCFDALCTSAIPYTFIHPQALVDDSVEVGAGSVLLAGCVIDGNGVIGENVLFNVGCVVAHDVVVGAHSFFGPGVAVSGNVRVGERTFVGVGTCISDGIRMADGVQTGAGAVVVHDCDTAGLVYGVPARYHL